jgi:HAD superfamily hydrolase (TIGR01484 family)
MKKDLIYVGFDRDGTLEAPAVPFPEALGEKIRQLQKQGVFVFIASGKSVAELQNIIADYGFSAHFICGESGGDFFPEHLLHAQNYPDLDAFKQKVPSIFSQLPSFYGEDKKTVWSKKFGKDVLDAEGIIKNFVQENNWRLNVYAHPFDGEGGLDVVPVGMSKALALAHIPQEAKIYYFGDAENDLEIMQDVRVLPNAPSNAKAEIKQLVLQKGGKVATQEAGLGILELLNIYFP